MNIFEQKSKNLNRLYYHGKVKNFDENQKKFLEFYLTTRKEYALPYAKRGGVVEIYQLKDVTNIFNMKSIKDESAFRKICQKDFPLNIKYINFLKENDWSSICGDEKKKELLQIVKKLNYDGFFNYEIDKEGLELLHNYGMYKFTNANIHSPSIGMFNTDKLRKIDEKPVEYFVNKEKELEYVKEQAIKALIKENFNVSFFVNIIKSQTFVLTDDEIRSVLVSIKKEDIDSYKERLNSYVESLFNRIYSSTNK